MFPYRLELPSGKPADPPHFVTSTPAWGPGDPVFIAPGKRYRVVDVRPSTSEENESVLVVRPD